MELPAPLQRYSDQIEEELRASLDQRDLPLYRMVQYQMGWVDESGTPVEKLGIPRLHSSLCLLACEALWGDVSTAMPAAAAVELVHNFFRIHDDIQDGSPQKSNRSAVWWVWGPGQAINVGDGMYALGRLALFRLADRGLPHGQVLQAVRHLDEASLHLFEGQHMELTFQERVDITQEQYFRMVERRAGALVGCALELGALVASGDKATIEAFGQSGRKLGIASQISDDLRTLWDSSTAEVGDQALMGRVLNKSKVLSVVYAFERGTIHQKRELGNIYFKRVLEPADVAQIIHTLDDVGAREYAQQQAEALAREALAILETHGITGSGLEDLHLVARYLVPGEW